MASAVPPSPMAKDDAKEGRKPWRRVAESGFTWVSPSPSPEVVAMLEGRFPEVVQVPVAALEVEVDRWEEKAILARTFHRWVPPEAIIREFRRGGVSGDIDPVSLAHRCHIFRFSDPKAKDLVLGRPWVANGQPVATEGWRAEFIPAADSVASALLWVRLPSLPMEFWNDDILSAILAPAGHFLFSDAATQMKSRGVCKGLCSN